MPERPPRKYSSFPKKLGACIEPLARPVLKARGLAGTRILTEWPSIVGERLARHAVPEKLSFPRGKKTGGTLTIAAENGFATELQHMQPLILERLAIYFGYQAVSRIAISHSFQLTPPPAPPARPAVLPPASERLAEAAEDEELKAALASLARTLSGQTT